jgi:hypothetical protein
MAFDFFAPLQLMTMRFSPMARNYFSRSINRQIVES